VARPPNGGLTLRAVLPNAITAAALCSGLTGIRFAINENWQMALFAIILAGVLDGIDGRIAPAAQGAVAVRRRARQPGRFAQLRHGAGAGDVPVVAAGTCRASAGSPASRSRSAARCGFARFNAQIDVEEQPHKSVGFLTGVPAPLGAGLAFLPMYLWIATGRSGVSASRAGSAVARGDRGADDLQPGHDELDLDPAAANIRPRSNRAWPGWSSAALLTEPWWTLVALCVLYLALMPLAIVPLRQDQAERALERKPVAWGSADHGRRPLRSISRKLGEMIGRAASLRARAETARRECSEHRTAANAYGQHGTYPLKLWRTGEYASRSR
jgi:CDP-diacylglycerol--serine O-phosphatidyltransferase